MNPSLPKFVQDKGELARIVRFHREAGRTVVLTNGTFDLLHVGHIRCLAAARALGDLLVVGVNSDRSVRLYKGPHLPVVPEMERVEVLSSLSAVDLVTLFDEPDAGALLELLAPDVHAKGTDYAPQTVPERDVVARYGGRIEIVGDPKTHSTRDLLRRIRELPGT